MDSEKILATTQDDYQVPLQLFRAQQPGHSILFLPALGMSARYYEPLGRCLAKNGINCVLFEQRGHGDSSLRAGWRTNYGAREWLEQDIPAAIQWMQGDLPNTRLIIMGHSLGGHYAACYAGLHPQQVQAVILSACGTPWANAYTGKTRSQLKFLYYMIPLLTHTLGYYPGDKLGFGGREARRLMSDWRSIVPDNIYHAEGMQMDFEAAISQYTGPVLGLRYDADHMAPKKAIDVVLDKFTNADVRRELLLSEQLGFRADHNKWARQPDKVVGLIVEWLNSA